MPLLEQTISDDLTSGIDTELVGADGLDITNFNEIGFILHNTGSNAITSLAVYWSNDEAGARWSVADAAVTSAFSSIAASSSFSVERPATVHKRMRIVAASSSGSTFTLDLFGRATGRPA